MQLWGCELCDIYPFSMVQGDDRVHATVMNTVALADQVTGGVTTQALNH